MTLAALLAFTGLLGLLGPRVVARRAWSQRAPRTALAVWAALVAALTTGVVLLGATLALSMVPISTDLAALLRACVLALQHRYATPGGAAATTGIVLVVVWLARLGFCVTRALVTAARDRRRHHELLALLAQPEPRLGAVVIEHPTPAVYCVPGRLGAVVLTSAARDTLTPDQLHAVLRHEQAHLRGRHHTMLAVADGFAHAFPRVPLLASLRHEVARLVELAADDAAARGGDRLAVAAALVRVAGTSAPAAALAAGAEAAVDRIQRLLLAPAALGWPRQVVIGVAALTLISSPVLLTIAPALLVTDPPVCPYGVPWGIEPCLNSV